MLFGVRESFASCTAGFRRESGYARLSCHRKKVLIATFISVLRFFLR